MTRGRIDAIARALSEGHPVDWASLEKQSHPAERASLQHLRRLAELTLPSRSAVTAPLSSASEVPTPWLWRLVTLIAAARGIVATAGFAYTLWTRSVPFHVLLQGSAMCALIACAAILMRVSADRRALNLAALLLVLASGPGQSFLPAYGLYLDAFLPWLAWSFVRDFPRVLRFSALDRICSTGARVSGAAGLFLCVANLGLAWSPAVAARFGLAPLARGGTSLYWAIVFGLTAPALVVMLARVRHAATGERRRVAFFLWAIALGLLPVVSIVALEVASASFDRFTSRPDVLPAIDGIIYASVLSIPFTTTYAVLVQQVLPIALVIRKTLRYALARGTLLAASIVPLVALAYWVFSNRELTIAALFTGPEAAGALALASSAIVLLLLRTRIILFLDRKYFREQVNLTTALASLTDALVHARDRRHVAEQLERAVERALQVEKADLYLDDDGRFAAVRGRGTPLDRNSAVAALLEASPEAVDLAISGLGRLLPPSDREWIAQNQVAALAPISKGDQVRGFIILSARQNDLDFSPEALVFLSTAAASAALALHRSADHDAPQARTATAEPDPAAECEACGRVTSPEAVRCHCGGRLRAAALPHSVAGKFDVKSRLGAGGMGIVYCAHDVALGRDVALKTLPRLTGAAADRLKREAQSMARVANPGLATIHGVETWRGAPVLVIELLEGGTLADRIRRGPLSCDEAVAVTTQIVRCLGDLHGQGLLHRDVKPANVGFTARGNVKLLDFGLAAALATETTANSPPDSTDILESGLTGTPMYLPPEAFAGSRPSESVDLWGAAMVLYESVAGQHPLAGARSFDDALRSLRSGRVPDVRRFRPECPDALAAFLRGALAPAPVDRPSTASAFLLALGVRV